MKRNDITGSIFIEYGNYVITKEERCITLYKFKEGINKKTKLPTYNYVVLGHYSNIHVAVKRILDDVDNPSTPYLQTYLNRFEAVYRDLKQLLEEKKKEE